MIIEDVTTSGASIAERLFRSSGHRLTLISLDLWSLDRRVVGLKGTISALDEIREDYGFPDERDRHNG